MDDRRALLDGTIAVAAFAATVPLTSIALEGFDPMPLTFARLLGAALPAFLLLTLRETPAPKRHQWAALSLVAIGGVIGFPLLTALALQGREAAPAAIALALIPLVTPAWARLRGHESPAPAFWLWAVAGSAVVLQFAAGSSWDALGPELFAAALAASIAYAEGGRLAREMPGWQVMAWALMIAAPVSALGFGFTWAQTVPPTNSAPWLALAFLAFISQFGAFWFWYRALATGVARTSQIQLLQPFLTLLLAGLLLGESIAPELWVYAALVVGSIYLTRTAGPEKPELNKETNP